LRSKLKLTPSEIRLTFEILKGDGLQAAADRLNITLSTARTHLAHIFEKTNTCRQAELVRCVLESDYEAKQEKCNSYGPWQS
jgi:DNA-binding CsgD family transcriptional regulator